MEEYTGELCSNNNTLIKGTNAPLEYDPGSELHHLTMSMIRGHIHKLERETHVITRDLTNILNLVKIGTY